jgi:hypothetical protein
MADDRAQARELATDALQDLADDGTPIEVGIRKAIRVAALCKHPFWQAWLQLQLVDLTGDQANLLSIKAMLDAALPDKHVSQEVAVNVFFDYTCSRAIDIPDVILGNPITDLEQLVQMAALLLKEDDNPGPKIFERVRRNKLILSRVKTDVELALRERGSWRREAIANVLQRLPNRKYKDELVEVLSVLTSFEAYEMLATARGDNSVPAALKRTVNALLMS